MSKCRSYSGEAMTLKHVFGWGFLHFRHLKCLPSGSVTVTTRKSRQSKKDSLSLDLHVLFWRESMNQHSQLSLHATTLLLGQTKHQFTVPLAAQEKGDPGTAMNWKWWLFRSKWWSPSKIMRAVALLKMGEQISYILLHSWSLTVHPWK